MVRYQSLFYGSGHKSSSRDRRKPSAGHWRERRHYHISHGRNTSVLRAVTLALGSNLWKNSGEEVFCLSKEEAGRGYRPRPELLLPDLLLGPCGVPVH
ncbi:hypothetical protein DSO57_1014881 [Entomophthora muscae]|uniref:Uncharacterized protein n=1 Tax=Entomophthora muscae TaxID=34485 RepID=A0ACC2TSX2_9FUNG|nr:hypothetical protein DSO57_1014881 [Entomophthora muscae]